MTDYFLCTYVVHFKNKAGRVLAPSKKVYSIRDNNPGDAYKPIRLSDSDASYLNNCYDDKSDLPYSAVKSLL